jgi:hypothetical protein
MGTLGGSQRRSDNTRKRAISAWDINRCWAGAMRTSENPQKAKFAEFLFHELG